MGKKFISPLLILSVLSIGIAARVLFSGQERGRGQEEPDRPKFYAKRILFEQNVKNADDALGEPDGRAAEIGPGGHLIVLMEERIYPSLNYDDGYVVLLEDSRFNVEGWFPMTGTQKPSQFAWIAMVRGQSPRGFRLAFMDPIEGSAGVNMIRISNDDTKAILMDAIVGYVRQERDDGDEHENLAAQGPLVVE